MSPKRPFSLMGLSEELGLLGHTKSKAGKGGAPHPPLRETVMTAMAGAAALGLLVYFVFFQASGAAVVPDETAILKSAISPEASPPLASLSPSASASEESSTSSSATSASSLSASAGGVKGSNVAEECLARETEKEAEIENGALHRADFPASFVFGTATSAFQVEGAAEEEGKGKSIWDVFTHSPDKVSDGTNADVADDSYHMLEEDVAAMKAMGVQSYRFSIAWSRVLPEGSGAPNEDGILYYNSLINALLREGIVPAATLYHWDLPQALETKYAGWLSRDVIPDFEEYAALCFSRFGDRVKTWITLNEPQQVTTQGYGGGTFAPGHCSDRSRCTTGNSSTEPYIAGHHLMLAHGAAVRRYRRDFQKQQGGRIGITLDCTFLFPLDPESEEDKKAAQRGLEFQLPWFADPVMRGAYPESMVESLGERLPSFSEEESAELKGTADFLGLNFYTASYAKPGGPPAPGQENPWADRQIQTQETDMQGQLIGKTAASPWLKVVPRAIYFMLMWLTERYPGLPLLITENGISQSGSLSMNEALCDADRISYHRDHLSNILKAIKDGAPVQAYYAWSLLDNFEWAAGYSQRFGIHFVDFSDPARPRIPKASALWWTKFLKPGEKLDHEA